jgi:hypothetical protein
LQLAASSICISIVAAHCCSSPAELNWDSDGAKPLAERLSEGVVLQRTLHICPASNGVNGCEFYGQGAEMVNKCPSPVELPGCHRCTQPHSETLTRTNFLRTLPHSPPPLVWDAAEGLMS